MGSTTSKPLFESTTCDQPAARERASSRGVGALKYLLKNEPLPGRFDNGARDGRAMEGPPRAPCHAKGGGATVHLTIVPRFHAPTTAPTRGETQRDLLRLLVTL